METKYLDDLLRIRAKRQKPNQTPGQKAWNDFGYLVVATKYLNMTSEEVTARNPRYTQYKEHPAWKTYNKSRLYKRFKNA